MSREEKEKLLTEKMENIRKKNEELRKRHEEIEADKKNADKFSSTVKMDNVKPYVMKAPRIRPEKSERPREAQEHPNIPRPSEIMPGRQRLSENDGPPPDPSYRFLSDPDRDGNERERKRDGRGKRKGKHGSKWGPGDGQADGQADGQEEEGEKVDGDGNMSTEFPNHGGQGTRGRGKSIGDQRFGSGRGRGSRGRGYGRQLHEQEYEEEEDLNKSDHFESHGGAGERNKPRSGLSFASRDIRYYPDENEDHRTGKDGRGRGRGRQNYSQWNHNHDNRNRSHRRDNNNPHGRGRNNDQQREYERWKAERAAIDEARLTRGKTDGGSWRREWDNDKISQGEVEEFGSVYDPRYPRSKSENFKLADLIHLPNEDGSAPPSQPQRKVQRERRKGNSQESREKFVKVDNQLAQKQPKLGGNDPKDTNWRSPPGQPEEFDDKNHPDDVIVISDDASDENAVEEEAPTERPKSVESMEGTNEGPYEEDPIDAPSHNEHTEINDKTDVDVLRNEDSVAEMNKENEEMIPVVAETNKENEEMVPVSETETSKENEEMISISETEIKKETVTESNITCDVAVSSE